MLTVTRRLFAGGLLAALAPRPALAPVPAPVPLLTDLWIAGDAYYGLPIAAPHLGPGSRLLLLREPGNPHDPLAVVVQSAAGVKLGYLPRARNEAAARLMDAGRRVTATITRADPGRHPHTGAAPWLRLRYDVHLV